MQKKELLYTVVHSMDKADVKNFIEQHQNIKQKNYVRLFQLIRKQSAYNEKEALAELSRIGVKHFSKEKKYLLELLFKYLDKNRLEVSSNKDLGRKLYLAELFYEKNELTLALDILKQALDIIKEGEFFESIYLVYKLQLNLFRREMFAPEDAAKFWNDFHVVKKQFDIYSEYENLHQQSVFLFKYSNNSINSQKKIEEFRMMLAHPIMQNPDYANSISSKIIYHTIYRTYHFITNEPAQLFYHSKCIIDLYTANPVYRDLHLEDYATSLVKMAEASFINNEHQLFDEIITLLAQHSETANKFNDSISLYQYHLQFIRLIKERKYEEGAKMIPDVNAHIQSQNIRLHNEIEILLLQDFITVTFACDSFKEMTKYLYRLGEITNKLGHPDYAMLHKTLEIIKYYEMGDMEYCYSKLRSITRNGKSNTTKEHYHLILKALEKSVKLTLSGKNTRKKLSSIFELLYNQLCAINDYPVFEEFPFIAWSASKSKGYKLKDNYHQFVLYKNHY